MKFIFLSRVTNYHPFLEKKKSIRQQDFPWVLTPSAALPMSLNAHFPSLPRFAGPVCPFHRLSSFRLRLDPHACTQAPTMEAIIPTEPPAADTQSSGDRASPPPPQTMSKNAQKKLLKQQRFEARKAEKKAAMKERKREEGKRKRREWAEMLASMSEAEREKKIEARRGLRKERMEKRAEEREGKIQRLTEAKEHGQNVVVDLEFAHLMTPSEIHSLVQQIMFCYAVNGRCTSPVHLWLTGCQGEIESQLKMVSGFDKWIIEKENRSYIEALQDQKEHLVYLTADAETILEELDSKKIYIVGGLVDRNRWKGITMKKAKDQGIQTAKLPIGNYLKMSSSQVLTVNQVIEILLQFLKTGDWKTAFFRVIPQRKRCEAHSDECQEVGGLGNKERDDQVERKKKCIEFSSLGEETH
ncbi:tRNA (guanine(9)-N1)-methyltransferase [Malania oleifera]|uniref:tRNA (guanine(9)-N1)-methyltransferase n=1 Tax=Malania oleifera TaxID=397392 RepID=UPI0025ADF695|nr:tRNA (guanine(9)-N1)-methyltransferase [Malania oleifera]